MFLAALFIMAKIGKQSLYPTMDEWVKKMWHITQHGILCSHKNSEFMSLAGKCMELEAIILSKLTQEQKTKHHVFSLISGS